MIKNTYSIHLKFQGNSVFQGKCNLLKNPENKKYIFSTVNLGHPLLFRASASCSKILSDKKYIFNTVKIPGPLCFSGQAQLAQNFECKNMFHTVEYFRETLFFRASASCSKSLM